MSRVEIFSRTLSPTKILHTYRSLQSCDLLNLWLIEPLVPYLKININALVPRSERRNCLGNFSGNIVLALRQDIRVHSSASLSRCHWQMMLRRAHITEEVCYLLFRFLGTVYLYMFQPLKSGPPSGVCTTSSIRSTLARHHSTSRVPSLYLYDFDHSSRTIFPWFRKFVPYALSRSLQRCKKRSGRSLPYSPNPE